MIIDMIKNTIDAKFSESFKEIYSITIDKNSIKYFLPIIVSNEFNFGTMIKKLREYVPHYCLSRSTYRKFKNNPMELAILTQKKFRNLDVNEGELAELMGFAFLESCLGAPKLISKMELKTNKNDYVKGSDGVHYLETETGYQLIFIEAKSKNNLKDAIEKAINSINDFKNEYVKDNNGSESTRLEFEKSLISTHIATENFTKKERQFIINMLYPNQKGIKNVDISFAVIILYDPNFDTNLKNKSYFDYREKVYSILKNQIEMQKETIKSLIIDKCLNGHNFYFYIVPIEGLEEKKKHILKEVLLGE